MPRPYVSTALRLDVIDKTGGVCVHCGAHLESGWHIDHHPIPFRDIENNVCCCAIRDPKLLSNLQPSCSACNVGHQHEPPNRAWFCGHTQCFMHRVTCIHLKWAGLWLCTVGICSFQLSQDCL